MLGGGGEQRYRRVVDVDDLDPRDEMLDELGVRRQVVAYLVHAARPQVVEGLLDPRQVFLPDRHAGRVEDVAVAPLAVGERPGPLANARLQLVPRAPQCILRPAAGGARGGHEPRHQGEDHQSRKLAGVDLHRVERQGEVVGKGHRGQAPRQQRRPQTAEPAGDQDRQQEQLTGRQHDRPQPQAQDDHDGHRDDGDGVAHDRRLRDVTSPGVSPGGDRRAERDAEHHAEESAVRTAASRASLRTGFSRNASAPASRERRRISSSA